MSHQSSETFGDSSLLAKITGDNTKRTFWRPKLTKKNLEAFKLQFESLEVEVGVVKRIIVQHLSKKDIRKERGKAGSNLLRTKYIEKI